LKALFLFFNLEKSVLFLFLKKIIPFDRCCTARATFQTTHCCATSTAGGGAEGIKAHI
jgi:hypothetical protein